MANIQQILNLGKSSLLTHQEAIATSSKNTSNINTEGYHKRDVSIYEVSPQGGIDMNETRRRTDAYLGAKMLDASSRQGAAQSKTTTLAAVDQLYADHEGGMGDAFDRFLNSLRALASDPADSDTRRTLLSDAQGFTDTVSGIATTLSQERQRADQQINGTITQLNELVTSLADLNTKISMIEGGGSDAGDLRDQRDLIARELGSFLDIRTFEDSDGSLTVLFAGGPVLVQRDQHAQMRSESDPAYDNLQRIDMVSISGATTDITNKLSTGRLGGLVDLRDNVLKGLGDQLDQFAYDISVAFNATHAVGFGVDGLSGRNFFIPPAAVAGAATAFDLETNLADNPDWIAAASTAATAIGGNDNLLALQNLEDQSLASGNTRTFGEELADMVGQAGRHVKINRENQSRAELELDNLQAMDSARTGVAIDEEMVDLMRFQQAYQAGARIVRTVDEMFQIINEL